MKIFLIFLGAVMLWSVWGYFSSNVEQAEYSVLGSANGYEVREYTPHIEAQTSVEGSYDEALNKGFSILAGYIFGGNIKKEAVAMTAPVREESHNSENIAMTTPVVTSTAGTLHTISFVMPKSYTLATLPTPNDSRVKLVEVPPKKVAALRFSWHRNTERIERMKDQLLSALSRDKIETVGNVSYAGYNAPWTPPWMVRNEVLVEIR